MFQERGLLWKIVRIAGTGCTIVRIFGMCRNSKFAYIGDIEPEIIYKDGMATFPAIEEKHVIYWDYQSHMATFRTNKDFGCVNFQHKK